MPVNPQSKTQQALALVREGLTPYAAAKRVDLSPNTLYVAIKREKKRAESCQCCPLCGQSLPK